MGIKSTPAFVAEPQCNGVSERFIRPLKEQLLWIQTFTSVAELNEAQARLAEAERELEEAVAELKRQEVDSCC